MKWATHSLGENTHTVDHWNILQLSKTPDWSAWCSWSLKVTKTCWEAADRKHVVLAHLLWGTALHSPTLWNEVPPANQQTVEHRHGQQAASPLAVQLALTDASNYGKTMWNWFKPYLTWIQICCLKLHGGFRVKRNLLDWDKVFRHRGMNDKIHQTPGNHILPQNSSEMMWNESVKMRLKGFN